MNEHMTTGELFYCLIEDIEDYTMRHDDNIEELDNIVMRLDEIKKSYDLYRIMYRNIDELKYIKSRFDELGYEQFSTDLEEIIERFKRDIKFLTLHRIKKYDNIKLTKRKEKH